MSETTREPDARRLATDARDRVRFEEDALALSDQVYRVARHLVGSREEAEDLMQETYARAFRSWRSFQPGTNLRAWLLRILTNVDIDDFSYADAAQILDIPIGTVMSRLHRGRRILKKSMADQAVGGEVA